MGPLWTKKPPQDRVDEETEVKSSLTPPCLLVTPSSQKVSAMARLRRHERVFGKNSLIVAGVKNLHENAAATLQSVGKATGLRHVGGALKHAKAKWNNKIVPPTAGTLYKRIGVLTVSFVMVTAVFGSTFDVSYAQYGEDAINQAAQEGALIADQDGYITKVSPQTVKTERTFKDVAMYTVESGDTLSGIAKQFDMRAETLMWENGVTAASKLKVGQRLNIPPADGVSHRVAAGQNVEKIAALYKVPAEKIVAINNIQNGVIAKDQIIFVPEGKPIPQATPISSRAIASTGTRSPARDSASRNTQTTAKTETLTDNTTSPKAGKFLIYPTIGQLTQGFKKGHYAFDIANRSKPPIWAAASGKVITAKSGTWGGGYGNHVVIDHGNGVQTLYAHLDHLNVKLGDKVTQGQVLGQMGRTGNVRGVTGIHLHFEVIDHGVKKSPSKYY